MTVSSNGRLVSRVAHIVLILWLSATYYRVLAGQEIMERYGVRLSSILALGL